MFSVVFLYKCLLLIAVKLRWTHIIYIICCLFYMCVLCAQLTRSVLQEAKQEWMREHSETGRWDTEKDVRRQTEMTRGPHGRDIRMTARLHSRRRPLQRPQQQAYFRETDGRHVWKPISGLCQQECRGIYSLQLMTLNNVGSAGREVAVIFTSSSS